MDGTNRVKVWLFFVLAAGERQYPHKREVYDRNPIGKGERPVEAPTELLCDIVFVPM